MNTTMTNPALRKKMEIFWFLYRRPGLIIELKDFALSQSREFPAGFVLCFLKKLRLALEKIEQVQIEQDAKKQLKTKSKELLVKNSESAALEVTSDSALKKDLESTLGEMIMYRMLNSWSNIRPYFDYMEDIGLLFKEEKIGKNSVPAQAPAPNVQKDKKKAAAAAATLLQFSNRMKGCGLF